MKPLKILWISETPTAFTGFSTVTREILARLARRPRYRVACLGWGYGGWPYDRRSIPYDIYPSHGRTFGRDSAARAIDEFLPDILISFGDLWMIDWIEQLPHRDQFKSVIYFPIDGRPFPPAWKRIVCASDVAVACSRFGQELVQPACPEVDVRMIYHGVDVEAFRPLTPKEQVKERHKLAGKFIVGCVARNQPRKNLPVLVKAFAVFCQDKEDALLYLHTNPKDIGWDLLDLVRRFGIEGRTAISRVASVWQGANKETLNEIYNLFDVFVLPTAGEGFGLPLAEAMAAGVPVAATRYSACVELVDGRGELIEVKEFVTTGHYNIELAIPDTEDLIGKLNLLYSDSARRERYGRAGREFAQQFSWDRVVRQWDDLLTGLA